MGEKEDFVEAIVKLPGVGRQTAEKLWAAGYRSVDDVKKATLEELVAKGVSARQAEAVLSGLGEVGKAKEAIEVVEKKPEAVEEKKEAVEIVPAAKVYKAKIKPQLTPEMAQALRYRRERLRREPEFRRYHWWYKTGISDSWRRPRGTHNKQRRGYDYRPPRVKVGYGKPAGTRGLHASGFQEVLVHNVAQLAKLDPALQAARIGGTVGAKKRKDIEAKAAELKIRILNPARGA